MMNIVNVESMRAEADALERQFGFRAGSAIRTLRIAASRLEDMQKEQAEFIRTTREWTEHPEEYDGPCECADCRFYAASDLG